MRNHLEYLSERLLILGAVAVSVCTWTAQETSSQTVEAPTCSYKCSKTVPRTAIVEVLLRGVSNSHEFHSSKLEIGTTPSAFEEDTLGSIDLSNIPTVEGDDPVDFFSATRLRSLKRDALTLSLSKKGKRVRPSTRVVEQQPFENSEVARREYGLKLLSRLQVLGLNSTSTFADQKTVWILGAEPNASLFIRLTSEGSENSHANSETQICMVPVCISDEAE